MKLSERIYWKGIEQLKNDPDFIKNSEKEFPEHLSIKDAYGDNTKEEGVTKSSRRDFLKAMGFSVAAVSLTACEAPVKKAIPYLTAPEEVVPSIPNYYASTYIDGGEASPVVIKTREGRPIFADGNAFSEVSKGKVNARVSASVLGLYDNEKTKNPFKDKEKTDWAIIDKEVSSKISSLGSGLRIVSQTLVSPTTQKLVDEFCAKTGAKHVAYDPVSASGIREANFRSFGKRVVPSYRFDKADLIISINADFLGYWLSQVEHSVQYAKTRKISDKKKTMSRHYQIESVFSNTGASADYRLPISPSQEGAIVAALYKALGGSVGGAFKFENTVLDKYYTQLIKDLKAANGKALVVSGSNDPDVQQIVNAINQKLGSYGNTIDIEKPSYQRKGDDKQMAEFITELGSGSAGVIFYNCNPVYDHPQGDKISQAISKAKLSLSTSERMDETASLCQYLTPDRHYLESWNDAEPKAGHLSLVQPTINPIFDTRQFQDSLIVWGGMEGDYYTYLRNNWKTKATGATSFESFWKKTLHDGVFVTSSSSNPSILTNIISSDTTSTQSTEFAKEESFQEAPVISASSGSYRDANWSSIDANIKKNYTTTVPTQGNEVELVVYPAPVMGTGSMANNPWIQETPDPITKLTWGHAVLVSMPKAKELGFETIEVKTSQAKITLEGKEYILPVIIQPGLPANTIAISLGYGHKEEGAGKVALEAGGENAYKMLSIRDGFVQYARTSGVTIEALDDTEEIARTQTHQTYLGRETIIQEAILKDYQDIDNLIAKKYDPKITMDGKKVEPTDISIWDIDNDGYGSEGDEIKAAEKRAEAEVKPGTEDNWLVRHREQDEYAADTFAYNLHHWGMVIDLNSCTGCSACIVACSIENNVPVVGKTEVANRREMHWMRIDRYYTASIEAPEGENPSASDYHKLKEASENPEVVFQPMMCQHCNNAPCETVCPVAATTHSSEGLNQMTYNRCVGTKYCANNCPYKVRRFNWFKYHDNDEFDYNQNNALGKMVLNPDVTVRSRGVMEKCSLCVQRIQSGKLAAKREGRKVQDGDVTTACASACPTNAITFGDLNNRDSQIVKALEPELEKRAYNVLHEINTRPNVWYLTKVRNQEEPFVPSGATSSEEVTDSTES